MDSDHWRARAKGGIFRREFLKYVGRFVQWTATVWAGAVAGDFLAQRRERAKRNIIAAEGRAAGTAVVIGLAETVHVTGTARIQFGVLTLPAGYR
jgi:hypothetical protein